MVVHAFVTGFRKPELTTKGTKVHEENLSREWRTRQDRTKIDKAILPERKKEFGLSLLRSTELPGSNSCEADRTKLPMNFDQKYSNILN